MALVTDAGIGLDPLPRTEFVEKFLAAFEAVEGEEILPLQECAGRVLARDMVSRYQLPSGKSAQGDSVAMRYEAFADGMPSDEVTATWVEGVDWVRADMGDDFPDEFNCTTHVEGVEFLEDGGIRLVDDPPSIMGPDKIKQPGSTMQVGDPVLPAGTVLTARTMAYLASVGHTVIPVRRKIRIAFIPTGSELVSAGEVLQRGKIADSNSFMIRQLILDAGADPIMFPIVSDSKEALTDALARAREAADLVLINGGSSKGSEDFNAALLADGATFYQHGVLLRPARVAAASVIDGKPHVNLPGPTMAAFVVWQWLVRYAIAKLQGKPAFARAKVKAVLAAPKQPTGHGPKGPKDNKGPKESKDSKGPERHPNEEFMRFFTLSVEDGRYVANPGSMGAGMMQCDALAIVDKANAPKPGDEIEVELI